MMRFSAFMASLAALCWTALCGQIDNSATRPYVDAKVAAGTVGMVTQGMSNVNLGTNLVTAGDASIGGDIHVDTVMPHVGVNPTIYMPQGWMLDAAGVDSIDWQGRVLYNSQLRRVAVWDYQMLLGTNDDFRLSWSNNTFYGNWTSTGNLSISNAVTASNIVQTAGGWDDFVFPANSLSIFAAADVTTLPVSNAIVFATTCTTNLANGDHTWATMQMPHGWVTNTMISPHVHFVQENADQTNMWFLRYKWYNIGDAVPATWIELDTSSNKVAYSAGSIHQIAEFPDVDGSHGMSSILDIKLYRKGTTGTGAVMLKQFDVHYRRNSFGSDQEYSKSF